MKRQTCRESFFERLLVEQHFIRRVPNAGVNTAGARIGVSYTFAPARKTGESPLAPAGFEAGMGYDLLLYGAPRQRIITLDDSPKIVPGKFAVFGLTFAPMYAFNPMFLLSLHRLY